MSRIFRLFQGGGNLPERVSAAKIALAGLGGFLAIAAVAALSQASGMLLILGSFGASCVLIFGFPQSPFSQPRNLIGGHFLSSLVGLTMLAAFGAIAYSARREEVVALVHVPRDRGAIERSAESLGQVVDDAPEHRFGGGATRRAADERGEVLLPGGGDGVPDAPALREALHHARLRQLPQVMGEGRLTEAEFMGELGDAGASFLRSEDEAHDRTPRGIGEE